ncbi:MAG: hypothetical protein A2Z16_05125 [Chloroflexi bacterium RBG_16_54_18]|nr:MAG: hypothetical protein A2Z16_05125 [Chloroflexi bacterium RBG_16_54_18]
MNSKWSLSEEIYRAFHRWPTLAGVILLGCLAGWLVSFIMPPYYKAITYIYVALNPYRTYSDTNFLALARPKYSNIDDYKDWQMTQLESVIYLDEFILETLERLREANPDWQDFSAAELREILEADWRSAGTWSLIANSPVSDLAEQASSAWSAVVVERVKAAIEAARQTFLIDQDLQAVSEQIQENSSRVNELERAQNQIAAWEAELNRLDHQQPLEPYLRLQIISQITRLAEFTPAWMGLLENQPADEELPAAYLSWIEQANVMIDQEIEAVNQRNLDQEQNKTVLSELYREKADTSLGLSPNLEIESIENGLAERIRPTTTFIIIGGFTAFLIWVLIQLVIITRKLVYE